MTKPKSIGGIGVPHIFRYYMAARLSEIVAMHRTPTMPWLDVENAGLAPLALKQIIWIPEKNRKIPDQLPPTTLHSLQIWDKYREKLHLSQCNTIYCTFLGNKKFPPGVEIRDFLPWTENNAFLCTTLVKGREICTFQDLKDSLQIPNSQLFRYLQIRHFISHISLKNALSPQCFAAHIITAAKTLRAAKWKSASLPTQQALFTKVKWIRNMETIRAYLQGKDYQNGLLWLPWAEFETTQAETN
ncbi:hypothetical protein XELAEV_18012245mg [Xenopus laevis]|uniref:Uncharacterized protein n=1 Tax=Xenopus laevis TaxID=8355 RepID=A0A974DNF1_XENLA|nr:hypothetical protein XELAEV_18012245mg [Xenopus laevis]